MMFNTDFEMFYDLTLEEETAKTTCTLDPMCGETDCTDKCPKSSTYELSMKFSQVSIFEGTKASFSNLG
jgi:hypothetical protein